MWTYLDNNGTKILGAAVGVLGILASTTDIIPPSAMKYVLLLIAILTYLRGLGNTTAIATQVVQQHMDAVAVAAATGTQPVIAKPGQLAPGGRK